MERAKSAAVRLRETRQWRAQFYGPAKILQHDKSIPKITDLCKSIEYIHTPFEALIPDREEWDQGRPEGQVGRGVYSEQLYIKQAFRLLD